MTDFNLELSTGTVYNQEYYTVRPKSIYFSPDMDKSEWEQMYIWCVDSLGSTAKDGVWSPGQRWYANNARFWFRDKEDQTMFLLRWS